MTSTPMNEFLTAAEQKLSGLFSCAQNASEFHTQCQDFDLFILDAQQIFNAPNPLPADEISRLKSLQRKITTIELVARNNAALVSDMPDYVDQSLSGLR